MKILITGAGGQLGQAFQLVAAGYPQHRFFFLGRNELDITDAAAVEATLAATGAAALVNCAAYTAVDKAEQERDAAFATNGVAPGVLAKACKEAGVRMVHISTDYVFDGRGSRPYLETDPVDPVNTYGASKLQGEEAVMELNPDAVIIRTSWVYAPCGHNFVKTMMRLMQSRPEIGVVADQQGSPTNALDLARAILEMLATENWKGGIYHYSNAGDITWYDFAVAIRELGGFDCKIKPLTTAEYPTPARRPAYSVMDKTRVCQTFGLHLQPWKESLASCIRQLTAASA